MSFLYEWVTNIILIILLATILELLLPSSAFQKYVKVVIGLLLIIAILNPLITFFSVDLKEELATFQLQHFENDKDQMENSIENKKSEIQASQSAYILEQMAVPLREKVESKLEERYEKRLKDVVVLDQSQPGSNESHLVIQVTLEDLDDEHAIETVKEVSIDTSDSTKEEEDGSDLHEIKLFLSKEWGLPKEQIVLEEEGGS
ncbi:stage III sporulation protein AF [Pseudalkalibacillus sp. SCS-8]|uniref:stage III sporulation protein AF n=1 Tax=Pseudalkalibacillus nanhaiensis TaxID=3115291 RepID=UPI0032DB4378